MPVSPGFDSSIRIAALFLLAGLGCGSPVNTVPPPVSPADPVQHYHLEVPESLEIISIDFDATTFAKVSGTEFTTGSKIGGRAFIEVHAVHRQSGALYLLIYEDIANRKTPVHVIRLESVPDSQLLRPDTPFELFD